MTRPAPGIASVATAVPGNEVPQSAARSFARGFFANDFPHLDRLLAAFDNTGIDKRHMACALPWYGEPHSFAEKNDIYVRTALELSHRAATKALLASGISARELGAIVFVTSTGIATPSLDSALVQSLDLPREIARVPLWGLGCAGGAAGLARASELTRATGKPTLLIAAEVCSTTFVHGDRSKSNLIATALFGDGAAAAVLTPEANPGGVAVLGSHSRLLDDSADVMGWVLHPEGLQVRFAKSIPQIVGEVIPRFVAEAAAKVGATARDFTEFVLHPGGAKVLAAYALALEVEPDRLEHAHAVIRAFGNMSSPTVLFVLERFLAAPPPRGTLALAVGLGPGFSAEGVMLRW